MMIIATNFKTNHTRKSTKEFLSNLNNFVASLQNKDEILVFPPNTAIDNFSSKENIHIGVQNAYPVEKGSFTGEIGLEQLDEFDIKTILIGHSERRHILGESQSDIAKKYNFFKSHNFKIVYCIGEPKEIREKGLESVIEYNFAQLNDIDLEYDNLIVAYEPVWAIGTGLTASVEEISETLLQLKKRIKSPILYGGSVKVENIENILKIKECDGVLVGTASWQIENFCKMIEISNSL